MSGNPISAELQQFVARHIHSIEQLEVFLLVSEWSDHSWSAPEVFKKIQSSEKSVANCMETFMTEGLLVREQDRFRLSTQNPQLAELASELRKAYRERHVAVVELIYKNPTRQIQSFADAFKFRKES